MKNDSYYENLYYEIKQENERLKDFINDPFRNIIKYNSSKVCKHLIVADLLSNLERDGLTTITEKLAKSVIDCEDEKTLKHPHIFNKNRKQK